MVRKIEIHYEFRWLAPLFCSEVISKTRRGAAAKDHFNHETRERPDSGAQLERTGAHDKVLIELIAMR